MEEKLNPEEQKQEHKPEEEKKEEEIEKGLQELEEEEKGKEAVKTALKIILGIVLIGVGIWGVIAWWRDLLVVFRGCIGLFLIFAGIIAIAIARE